MTLLREMAHQEKQRLIHHLSAGNVYPFYCPKDFDECSILYFLVPTQCQEYHWTIYSGASKRSKWWCTRSICDSRSWRSRGAMARRWSASIRKSCSRSMCRCK